METGVCERAVLKTFTTLQESEKKIISKREMLKKFERSNKIRNEPLWMTFWAICTSSMTINIKLQKAFDIKLCVCCVYVIQYDSIGIRLSNANPMWTILHFQLLIAHHFSTLLHNTDTERAK